MHFEQNFLDDLTAGMWTSLKWLALLVAVILLALWISGCATHTINISPTDINATSTTLIYCPSATVTRIEDGNRTVDVLSDTSGVGTVLQSLGNNAAEVLKP